MTVGRVVVMADRDDDPTAAVIRDVLRGIGADVAVTSSAELAAESVQYEHASTVLVASADRELVDSLRASTSHRQRAVSVVVLVDDPDDADAALAAGADSVLIRPVESERLVEAVTRLA